MSWQAYVDDNLVGTGKISRAAILGLQGGVWASSAGYNLTAEEQKAVVDSFARPDEAQAHGVKLAGQKFFTLQASDQHVYGKKGADGCVLVKTKQAVLVTEYTAPIQAGEATTIVEKLADYLKSVNY
ncbi:profilin [Fomitiporia mediterranea MF3/22]|uniref:profilin n=1 Tax=Fomitiporia mediterranea (strain MF3/22) TaxID=694068 RepID=UPI00044087D3|nr:profilin [Fomitiporia mediterranea MF3/22]EJD07866.1 profilin [Fomitiporia mediterranea MF3/22]